MRAILRLSAIALLVATALVSPPLHSQETTREMLPVVRSAETPFYPRLANAARIQGTVTLEVKTDGAVVTVVKATGAHKMLMEAAEQNIRTWRFYPHKPTRFNTIYIYRLSEERWAAENQKMNIEFPTRVEIVTPAPSVEW